MRAGIVRRAEDYRWSSAPAHCELTGDAVLTRDRDWLDQIRTIGDWSAWLAEPDRREQVEVLRQHVERGLPCGSEDFVRGLEFQAGQALRPTARGRPMKAEQELAE